MSAKEYRTAASAQGGLLTVRGAQGIAFGDRVQIRDHRDRRFQPAVREDGEKRIVATRVVGHRQEVPGLVELEVARVSAS